MRQKPGLRWIPGMPPVGVAHELEQRAGQLAGELAELLLERQPLHGLGDLAHRTLVVERLARSLGVAHHARRFR